MLPVMLGGGGRWSQVAEITASTGGVNYCGLRRDQRRQLSRGKVDRSADERRSVGRSQVSMKTVYVSNELRRAHARARGQSDACQRPAHA